MTTTTSTGSAVRLAIDIGGTFTDIVLERAGRHYTHKVLTTPNAPEDAVVNGVGDVLALTGTSPASVNLVLHGTTLATNALIERKGARTALLTTEGFRDVLEMGYEKRYAPYDLRANRPDPLVPRQWRFGVHERIAANGKVLKALDRTAVRNIAQTLSEQKIEALAIGFLHAYAHSQHEAEAADIVSKVLPDLPLSLSSDVCPVLREYERLSTTVANAYVQPMIAGYLERLQQRFRNADIGCPVFLMTSGGGLTTLEQAQNHPIRLVESGPAGGAMFAAEIAQSAGVSRAMAFDMGGTTAKIALLENAQPELSNRFEVARVYRDMKGSGLPVRIPVIEMVEIGAGGGSIARVDDMKRIRVGPESAGSEPGPVAYAQGGTKITVTDANLLLGKLDPQNFAGGRIPLDKPAAATVIDEEIGSSLGLDSVWSAAGITEIVEENMANAARVHAVERGKEPSEYTMIAFGGGAPLHAAQLARKLGMCKVIVPVSAGVGSAVGFLCAPVSYQISKSYQFQLASVDAFAVNKQLDAMQETATSIVERGISYRTNQEITEFEASRNGTQSLLLNRQVDLRYVGQGHEIAIPLDDGPLDQSTLPHLRGLFEAQYQRIFGLTMPEVDVECVSLSVKVASPVSSPSVNSVASINQPDNPGQATQSKATSYDSNANNSKAASSLGNRDVYDPPTSRQIEYAVYARSSLAPGCSFEGPALVEEDETCTVVPTGFTATVKPDFSLVLEWKR